VAVSDQPRRRLRVNPVQCDAFGYCAEMLPELINLDDWGFPIVNSRPLEGKGLLKVVEGTVAACPRLALLLEVVPPDSG
jgi:ferredoxin